MTRKLEETLDLPRLDEALRVLREQEEKFQEGEREPNTADEFRAAIERSMALEDEILSPKELIEHDREMDEIANKSMSAFHDLRDLGFNVETKHSGPIFESMVNVLRLSMDARNAKVDKRLKLSKMQLDRDRLEMQKKAAEKNDYLDAEDEVMADRNKILDMMPKAQTAK